MTFSLFLSSVIVALSGSKSIASFTYEDYRIKPRACTRLHETGPTTTKLHSESSSEGLNDIDCSLNLAITHPHSYQPRRQFVSFLGGIGLSYSLGKNLAFAEGIDKVDIDSDDESWNRKIILQTDSKNVPRKYVGTSPYASIADQDMEVSRLPSSRTINLVDTVAEDRRRTNNICSDSIEEQRISVFERAAPSVAFIDTFVEQRDAFTTNILEVPLGTGSGIVWDDKGHIVTNYHVVRSAASAQVAILTRVFPALKEKDTSFQTSSTPRSSDVAEYTRKVYKASVVGVDPGKDLAVLKIDAPVFDLYPIELGTSKGLKVGQTCYAIGNPYGLDHSLTSGVVSGLGREVKSPIGRPITNVIQTDAAINPGNSGGPLLDSAGKMIGINTSIFSPSGGSAGIGFAIPIDTVKYIVETLLRDGKVIRPVMGITYLQSSQARTLGITKGVLVLDVPPNSAAAKAGMKGTRRTESGLIEIGDIIIQIEDMKIDSETDLLNALESFKPGVVVKVVVNRPNVEGTPSEPRLTMTTKTLYLQLSSTENTTSQYLLFLSPE